MIKYNKIYTNDVKSPLQCDSCIFQTIYGKKITDCKQIKT